MSSDKDMITTSDEQELNDQVAAQMLETILDACEVEQNSVPLDVLVSYSNYRKERFALQKVIIVLLLVVICALPFLFISPKFTVEMASDSLPYAPKYTVTVNSFLPVNKVSASIDGYSVPVYEVQSKVYAVEPATNGEMTISVTLFNHQTAKKTISVTGMDTVSPVLLSNQYQDGQIAITVMDEASGINYEATRAVDQEGHDVYPASWDEEQGIIYFDYPDSSLNVYVYDKAGNALQLILTIQ